MLCCPLCRWHPESPAQGCPVKVDLFSRTLGVSSCTQAWRFVSRLGWRCQDTCSLQQPCQAAHQPLPTSFPGMPGSNGSIPRHYASSSANLLLPDRSSHPQFIPHPGPSSEPGSSCRGLAGKVTHEEMLSLALATRCSPDEVTRNRRGRFHCGNREELGGQTSWSLRLGRGP